LSLALAAFAAGMVSFATPCVLPLVPAYLSAIGARADRPRTAIRAGVPFVLGFSAVFVAMGVGAALIGGQFADHRIDLIHVGGIVIVAMGFAMMGLLPIPALERSLQPAVEPARGSGSALLLGGAFGLCWTPCVGPVLAALLALAGSSRTAGSGAALLAAYSAGLAVPFLAAGVAFGKVMAAARSIRDHYTAVRVCSGVILVAVGLAMFFDRMYVLNVLVNRVVHAV
jgi:cytochrome c-type biogenesis protein